MKETIWRIYCDDSNVAILETAFDFIGLYFTNIVLIFIRQQIPALEKKKATAATNFYGFLKIAFEINFNSK